MPMAVALARLLRPGRQHAQDQGIKKERPQHRSQGKHDDQRQEQINAAHQ
jgi:hypothetical protein